MADRYRFLLTSFLLLLWGNPAFATTSQIDRRIEEVKRAELSQSVEVPIRIHRTAPPKTPSDLPSAPAPRPMKELYFNQLGQKRIAFRYDAAKAVTLLMNVDQKYIDLDAQTAYLRELKLLPAKYDGSFDPMQPLRKGVLAFMFYRLLELRGGVVLMLFGPSERYALKELAFQGFLAPGHVDDLVSGEELVYLLTRATEHRMKRLPAQ
jgi:hypothetical protein